VKHAELGLGVPRGERSLDLSAQIREISGKIAALKNTV
jgi:hypothetical protein